jgi:hypothetical protein
LDGQFAGSSTAWSAIVARFFRFLEKKRGRRRTGSNLLGSMGEAVFCGSMFLLGTLSLTALIATEVIEHHPESFAVGLGRWLLILVMASFVIIGGAGLIWTAFRVGTSAERRNVMARQAADINLVQETLPRPRNYPTLPTFEGLTNSPGTELAFRLPPTHSPGWRLLATTVFALVWNGVGCVLTVWAIRSHLEAQHQWFLTIFLAPFWAVSAWSIRYLLQLIWMHTGMGLTTLEISELPLLPGRAYQVALAQHGHIRVKSLQLWLVCEEEATYHQGTDIRTERREVHREQFFEQGDFRIEPALPFQTACGFAVPAGAMHSFHSQHHSISWKLVVRGEAEGWPVFERGFTVVVFPGQLTMQIEVGSNVARAAQRPHVIPAAGAGASA